jgi:phage tail sheath protein FI
MPAALTYPGVYVEEIPSPVRTITAVPTAVAAFVGRAVRGPVNTPVRIHSFSDFERAFGGLWNRSELGYAVQQYFGNGGADAFVVRVVDGITQGAFDGNPPRIDIPTTPPGTLSLAAKNPGAWFNGLSVDIDYNTRLPLSPSDFNLRIRVDVTDPITGAVSTITETYRNLTGNPASPDYFRTILDNQSSMIVTASAIPLNSRPSVPASYTFASNGAGTAPTDGTFLATTDITPPGLAPTKQGIFALEDADIFTLLVLPGYASNDSSPAADLEPTVWSRALKYCQDRRAMLLVDPPTVWKDKATAYAQVTNPAAVPAGTLDVSSVRDKNAVLYFPRVLFADPLRKGETRPFAPSAAMAGLMARMDSLRGVWKAPAGEEARLADVQALGYSLTDLENGDLNPLAINCLRNFPIVGTVSWGARTLAGADAQASEWKYLPVRRVALFIEESLYRGTRWVVFEPNDEPLWSQIRLNVGAFMNSLFRQGAFQGATPKQAYFVKCDADTTTQDDINKGIVNILVGFAPLKPVEFVVIKISQIAGQIPV